MGTWYYVLVLAVALLSYSQPTSSADVTVEQVHDIFVHDINCTLFNDTEADLLVSAVHSVVYSDLNVSAVQRNGRSCREAQAQLVCDENQYEEQRFDARVVPPLRLRCSNISTCQPGTYMFANATLTSDRECKPCGAGTFSDAPNALKCDPWRDCEVGSGQVSSPNSTSNRICEECAAGTIAQSNNCTRCDDGYAIPNPGSNGTCETYACPAGTKFVDASSPCQACVAGQTYQNLPKQSICNSCSTCSAGKYVNASCTTTTDIQCVSCAGATFQPIADHNDQFACTNCSTCNAGEFANATCTATSDRTCAACEAGGFQSATDHTETACETCGTCGAGEVVAADCSLEADIQCDSCGSGFFQPIANHTSVTACTQCGTCGAAEFASSSCTSTSDIECQSCEENTFQSATQHNNTDCIPCTTCGAGQGFNASCTNTTDTVCDACVLGQTFMNLMSHSEKCKPVTTCSTTASEVEITAPTLTSDRVCGSGPDRRRRDTFENCTAFIQFLKDATCTNCSLCPQEQRVSEHCTNVTDTVCVNCDPGSFQAESSFNGTDCTPCSTCNAGEKVKSFCTLAQDTSCESCEPNTFQSASNHSNSACSDCSLCPAGQRVTAFCTLTADTQCTACSENTFQAEDAFNGTACQDCGTCGLGELVTDPCTNTSDVRCESCPDGSFQPSSSHLNTTCTPFKSCNDGEVETTAPSSTSDRVCTPCPMGTIEVGGQCVSCGQGHYINGTGEHALDKETGCAAFQCPLGFVDEDNNQTTPCVECTSPEIAFNRRECQNCSSSQYRSDAVTCTNLTVCDASKEYESTAPTDLTDRQCSNLTVCNTTTHYQSVAPTASTDRRCAPFTVCDSLSSQEIAGPTSTSDRICFDARLAGVQVNFTVSTPETQLKEYRSALTSALLQGDVLAALRNASATPEIYNSSSLYLVTPPPAVTDVPPQPGSSFMYFRFSTASNYTLVYQTSTMVQAAVAQFYDQPVLHVERISVHAAEDEQPTQSMWRVLFLTDLNTNLTGLSDLLQSDAVGLTSVVVEFVQVVDWIPCIPCNGTVDQNPYYFRDTARCSGLCTPCTPCPAGQYATTLCTGTEDTVCAPIPTDATAEPFVTMKTNPSKLLPVADYSVNARSVSQGFLPLNMAPGETAFVTPTTETASTNVSVVAQLHSATSAQCVVATQAVYPAAPTFTAALQVADELLNTMTDDSLVTLTVFRTGSPSSTVVGTCTASQSDGPNCVIDLEIPSDWFTPSQEVQLSSSVQVDGTPLAQSPCVGGVLKPTGSALAQSNTVVAVLPNRLLYPDASFDAVLVARSAENLRTVQVDVALDASMTVSSISAAPGWSVVMGSVSPNVVRVTATSGLPSKSLDSQQSFQLATITVAVSESSTTLKFAPSVVQMLAAEKLQPILPPNMFPFDGVLVRFGQPSVTEFVPDLPQIVGLFLGAENGQGQLYNTAVLTSLIDSVALRLTTVWSTEPVLRASGDFDFGCTVTQGSNSLAVEADCSELVLGPDATAPSTAATVEAALNLDGTDVTGTATFAVWVPETSLTITPLTTFDPEGKKVVLRPVREFQTGDNCNAMAPMSTQLLVSTRFFVDDTTKAASPMFDVSQLVQLKASNASVLAVELSSDKQATIVTPTFPDSMDDADTEQYTVECSLPQLDCSIDVILKPNPAVLVDTIISPVSRLVLTSRSLNDGIVELVVSAAFDATLADQSTGLSLNAVVMEQYTSTRTTMNIPVQGNDLVQVAVDTPSFTVDASNNLVAQADLGVGQVTVTWQSGTCEAVAQQAAILRRARNFVRNVVLPKNAVVVLANSEVAAMFDLPNTLTFSVTKFYDDGTTEDVVGTWEVADTSLGTWSGNQFTPNGEGTVKYRAKEAPETANVVTIVVHKPQFQASAKSLFPLDVQTFSGVDDSFNVKKIAASAHPVLGLFPVLTLDSAKIPLAAASVTATSDDEAKAVVLVDAENNYVEVIGVKSSLTADYVATINFELIADTSVQGAVDITFDAASMASVKTVGNLSLAGEPSSNLLYGVVDTKFPLVADVVFEAGFVEHKVAASDLRASDGTLRFVSLITLESSNINAVAASGLSAVLKGHARNPVTLTASVSVGFGTANTTLDVLAALEPSTLGFGSGVESFFGTTDSFSLPIYLNTSLDFRAVAVELSIPTGLAVTQVVNEAGALLSWSATSAQLSVSLVLVGSAALVSDSLFVTVVFDVKQNVNAAPINTVVTLFESTYPFASSQVSFSHSVTVAAPGPSRRSIRSVQSTLSAPQLVRDRRALPSTYDYNGDSSVDMGDTLTVLAYFNGELASDVMERLGTSDLDLNSDGLYNMEDVSFFVAAVGGDTAILTDLVVYPVQHPLSDCQLKVLATFHMENTSNPLNVYSDLNVEDSTSFTASFPTAVVKPLPFVGGFVPMTQGTNSGPAVMYELVQDVTLNVTTIAVSILQTSPMTSSLLRSTLHYNASIAPIFDPLVDTLSFPGGNVTFSLDQGYSPLVSVENSYDSATCYAMRRPTNLTLTLPDKPYKNGDTITVSWIAPLNPPNGATVQYRVQWRLTSDQQRVKTDGTQPTTDYEDIRNTDPNTFATDLDSSTTVELTTLQPYVEYEFRVLAFFDGVPSVYSEPRVARTSADAPAAAVSNITVSSPTSKSIAMTWSAMDETLINGPGSYRVRWELPVDQTNPDCANICDRDEPEPGCTMTSKIAKDDVAHPGTSYVFESNIAANTTYCWKVVAFNWVYSPALDKIVMLSGPDMIGTVNTISSEPEVAPENVTVTVLNSTAIHLEFDPPSNMTLVNGVLRRYRMLIRRLDTSFADGTTVPADAFEDGNEAWHQVELQDETSYVLSGALVAALNTTIQEPSIVNLRASMEYEVALIVIGTASNGEDAPGLVQTAPVVFQLAESAPTEGPSDVNTSANSTAIVLSWNLPSASARNGLIVSYYIELTRNATDKRVAQDQVANCVGGVCTVTVPASGSDLALQVLADLESFVYYNVSVAAETAQGRGPLVTVSQLTAASVPTAGVVINEAGVETTNSSIRVSFEAPAWPDRNGDIARFDVEVAYLTPTDFHIDTDFPPVPLPRVIAVAATERFFFLDNLQSFIDYTVSITVVTTDQDGLVEFQSDAEITTMQTNMARPSASPKNVVLNVLADASEPLKRMEVTFDAPPGTTRNGILTHFIVYYRHANGTEYTQAVPLTPAQQNQPTLTVTTVLEDLDAHVEYDITVSAVNNLLAVTEQEGPRSALVSEVTDSYLPTASPAGLSLAETTTQASNQKTIRVTWAPPPFRQQNGVITFYRLRISDSTLATISDRIDVSGTETEHTFTGLHPGVTFVITVSAVNVIGEGPTTQADLEVSEYKPTGTVQTLQFTSVLATSVSVSWDQVAALKQNGVITKYVAQLHQQQSSYADVSSAHKVTEKTVTSTSVFFSGLEAYVDYTVTVSAFTAVGEGPTTQIETRTAAAKPDLSPSPLTSSNVDPFSIELSWRVVPNNRLNGPFANYRVEYESDKQTFSANGGNNAERSAISVISKVTSGTSMRITDLEPNRVYTIRVRALVTDGGNILEGVATTDKVVRTSQFYATDLPTLEISEVDKDLELDAKPWSHRMVNWPQLNNKFGEVTRVRLMIVHPDDTSVYGKSLNCTLNPSNCLDSPANGDGVKLRYVAYDSGTISEIQRTLPPRSYGFLVGDETDPTNPELSPKTAYDYRLLVTVNRDGVALVAATDPLSDTVLEQSTTNGNPTGVTVAVIIIILLLLVLIGLVVLRKRNKNPAGLFDGQQQAGPSNGFQMTSAPPMAFGHASQPPTAFAAYSSGPPTLQQQPASVATTSFGAPVPAPRAPAHQAAPRSQALGAYQNPPPASHEVAVADLPQVVQEMSANTNMGFGVEYDSIETGAEFPRTASLSERNRQKNRYANILAYDHSRVRLSVLGGDPSTDYINANYIDGYSVPRYYIAAQGPLPTTVLDFWRMLWEQRASCIVMVTNLEEKGRIKCHQYWPDRVGDTLQLTTNMGIRFEQQEDFADFVVRTLTVYVGQQSRVVIQYHYVSWPDHGVPDSSAGTLQLLRKAKAVRNQPGAGPMVVHCSAGVGRTGTFIAIDYNLDKAALEKSVDVQRSLNLMRRQRNTMVQTEGQYAFIYTTLCDELSSTVTEMNQVQLREHYRQLEVKPPGSGMTNLEMEFKRLNQGAPPSSRCDAGMLPANAQKNRFANILPFDQHRVKLLATPGVVGSDYINASTIDDYKQKNAFIATQAPLEHTTNDFWKMVWEQDCHSIVMMVGLQEGDRVKSHQYWPNKGDSMRVGNFVITNTAETVSAAYVTRTLTVTNEASDEYRDVHHWQFTAWPERGSPASGSDVASMINEIETYARSRIVQPQEESIYGNAQIITEQAILAQRRPLVVHCTAGVGRTGAFIAMCICIKRMQEESKIDLYHVTKHLRTQRTMMIQSPDQYQFVYRVIIDWLDLAQPIVATADSLYSDMEPRSSATDGPPPPLPMKQGDFSEYGFDA
eukprot:m.332970 g.332970  ORF g.332970 m.332970 type:complete len:4476 (-) comp16062_c0_seq1:606-14033(-)